MSVLSALRQDDGPIAVLTLNRPERRNALSLRLVSELSDLLTRTASEPGVRVVIVTGAGPTFCSGMDLKEAVADHQDAEDEKKAVAYSRALADLLWQVHGVPKPTIAALNGDAIAGGAGLASACDFAIAAEGSRVGYPEVRRGMVAAIVMHDLIRQVGDRRARDLLLSGRLIPAAEAERWGLVNRVVPAENLMGEALTLGFSLVESGPLAIESTKRLIDEASGRPANSRGSAAITAAVRVSDEAREGIRAFFEKRPPRWAAQDRARRGEDPPIEPASAQGPQRTTGGGGTDSGPGPDAAIAPDT
jgi:methylglutaconyl-CoA hydratase